MSTDNARTSNLLDQVEAIIKAMGISKSEAARQLGVAPQQLSIWLSRRSLMGEGALLIQEWVITQLNSIMRNKARRHIYESHLSIIKSERKKKT